MGDLADSFNALREYKAEQRNKIEPNRFKYATEQLESIGATVIPNNDGSRSMKVVCRDITVTFFPYTGWASGKGIKDGRGIHNLIKQLEAGDENN